ncbi:MAG: hypothetical protein JO197_23970 [Acidobacteria bacterium]|nr:hypothetical protein [Acidobacteriota bacterium]MBV9474956.1 hypothetical protein [Acidobacteriota bacterium]
MAIVMQMHWPEVSREQYEEVRRSVNWENEQPDGGLVHVAWFGADGFHVFDVWQSQEQFQNFVQHRLTPGTQRAGLTTAPNVRFDDAHAMFVADAVTASPSTR